MSVISEYHIPNVKESKMLLSLKNNKTTYSIEQLY